MLCTGEAQGLSYAKWFTWDILFDPHSMPVGWGRVYYYPLSQIRLLRQGEGKLGSKWPSRWEPRSAAFSHAVCGFSSEPPHGSPCSPRWGCAGLLGLADTLLTEPMPDAPVDYECREQGTRGRGAGHLLRGAHHHWLLPVPVTLSNSGVSPQATGSRGVHPAT